MPGTVTLFGSGETSSTGGRIFDALARKIPSPLNICVLETPAGFEVNSARVAGRISDFLAVRLQNYKPRISQIAARKKGTQHSPDSPEIAAPLYEGTLIFLGPGSPTYAVRQLQDSLTWHILQARQRLGASLVFASAATVAAGSPALPVYEIFKAGEDPHWKPGLDFFAPYGLSLAIVPHWNNQDGGDELDTSRCFIGRERFEQLLTLLPAGKTVLGIDESTAVTLDFDASTCTVGGLGSVHVLNSGQSLDYPSGHSFPLQSLGSFHPIPDLSVGLPEKVWDWACLVERDLAEQAALQSRGQPVFQIPPGLQQMVEDREDARRRHDWSLADRLRHEMAELGWQVSDSPDGPQLSPLKSLK